MSQSLISNYLTYSNSGATQSCISGVASAVPPHTLTPLKFRDVSEDGNQQKG